MSRWVAKMYRLLVLATLLLLGTTANAQLQRCVGADGRVTLSDSSCPAGTVSARTIAPRDNTLDSSGLRQQVQRDQRRSAQEASHQQELNAEAERRIAQERESVQRKPSGRADASAIDNCIRDVERQPATQETKARLIAACQSAARWQNETGTDRSAVQNCVHDVERTAASGSVKARSIARCHGADVGPDPLPRRPSSITR